MSTTSQMHTPAPAPRSFSLAGGRLTVRLADPSPLLLPRLAVLSFREPLSRETVARLSLFLNGQAEEMGGNFSAPRLPRSGMILRGFAGEDDLNVLRRLDAAFRLIA